MAYWTQTLSPRVIRDLKKRSFLGVFIYTIALTVVLFADGYYFRRPDFSNRLLICITGICFIRLVHLLWNARQKTRINEHDKPSIPDLVFFVVSVCVTALIWGTGFALVMAQPDEVSVQLLMLVCTIGMCAGGVSSFSPNFYLCLAFSASMLIPGMLTVGIWAVNLPLFILLTMFFTYTVFLGARMNAEYLTALSNEALLEKKTRDLERISNVDGLTGIYNRRYFDTALDVAWKDAVRNKTRLALVLCDIDFFKKVNDEFGHLAGDEFLKIIAHTMSQVFKRKTDIAARYGGEEFVVLITKAMPGRTASMAEGFRKAVDATRMVFEHHTVHTTISIGVAEILPAPGMDKDILISRADAMLYEAKHKGRNRVKVFGE